MFAKARNDIRSKPGPVYDTVVDWTGIQSPSPPSMLFDSGSLPYFVTIMGNAQRHVLRLL